MPRLLEALSNRRIQTRQGLSHAAGRRAGAAGPGRTHGRRFSPKARLGAQTKGYSMTLFRLGLLLVVATALLAAGPALASEPSGDSCNGHQVEFRCYNQTSGNKCGSRMGSSCYSEHWDKCSADGGYGCNNICGVKKWCNSTFPDCCQDNCAAYWNYSVGGYGFSHSCPGGWKP